MNNLKRFLKKVNDLEEDISKLTDLNLKNKTLEFKDKLKNGKSKDDFIAEAYAVVREAVRRVTNKRLYDVQIMAGFVLNQGRIAEVKAGERENSYCNTPCLSECFGRKWCSCNNSK